MALDERSRHELYLRLEETLGPEAATTLMEHLPPVGWADVATKRDLDALRGDLDHLADRLRAEFYKAMAEQTRTIVLTVLAANVGAVVAVAGLAFAAARVT
jgi:hypothetical protein